MPNPQTTQAWAVRLANNPDSDTIHLCLDCMLKGVDEDMEVTEMTVEEADGPLNCEHCGTLIIDGPN